VKNQSTAVVTLLNKEAKPHGFICKKEKRKRENF
jgi:hypothetical protein